jgi:hypothetical protein
MARYVTATAQARRDMMSAFLTHVFGEAHLTKTDVADALKAAGQTRGADPRGGDIRHYLYGYEVGSRSITADVAFDLGQALASLGVAWANGAVLLYASGLYSDWVELVWHLCQRSVPSAIVVAFVTPAVASPSFRPFATWGRDVPREPSDVFEGLWLRECRCHSARVSPAIIADAGREWRKRRGGVPTIVNVAAAIGKARDTDVKSQERLCVSLAIELLSKVEHEADVSTRADTWALYKLFLGLYDRALPMLRPVHLSRAESDNAQSITVGQVDNTLDRFPDLASKPKGSAK